MQKGQFQKLVARHDLFSFDFIAEMVAIANCRTRVWSFYGAAELKTTINWKAIHNKKVDLKNTLC